MQIQGEGMPASRSCDTLCRAKVGEALEGKKRGAEARGAKTTRRRPLRPLSQNENMDLLANTKLGT